ncbi:MAG TPA: Spy/CpxP family protein refolding chaperone [Bradyrhizobium sp.]|nr:Spy/CpxP family protein refolding chaperone [Bradyrhizobium sp.]
MHNPAARARLTARAATAGWRGREGGWWRHRNGGYGWVGPLFWPFAYYDIYGYSLWGYGYDDSFWNYGYGDIYAGLFGPYGYDDLMGYLPQAAGSDRAAANPTLAQMCGQDSRDIAGLPIDSIQRAIQPNDEQRAALDDLANASVKAAQDLRKACPTEVALTAPKRLEAMQSRIEAMSAAVDTVKPPVDKFYGLLDDEQKARLTALGQRTVRRSRRSAPVEANCGASQPGFTAWPTAAIDKTVKPTEAQHDGLAALQDAAAKAADMLKDSCAPETALTPTARLDAVGKRLDTMLQAVKTVRSALDPFYASLSDEQKAAFDAIGPQRPRSPNAETTDRHRRVVNVERVIRGLISMIR